MPKPTIPYGIICLWQIKKQEDRDKFRRDRDWEIIESYPIDSDGYPTTNVVNVDGRKRQPHMGWMRKPIKPVLDDDDEETEDAMGRAITLWTMSGVELLGLHPETWESVMMFKFHDLLKVLKKKWIEVLECGYHMEQATIRVAQKLLFEQPESK